MKNENPSRESTSPPRASRVGLTLFGIYVLLYGGFMTLVLVRPDLVAQRPFGGVNVAIASGLGLIVAAIVLATGFLFAPTHRG
jgi:uncharacterized membrane protein (DUF485 family)